MIWHKRRSYPRILTYSSLFQPSNKKYVEKTPFTMSGVYQIPQLLTKGDWAIKIDLAHGMFTTLNVHYFCIIFLVYYGCKEHSFGLSIGGQDSLQNLQQRGTYSDNCSQRIDSIRGDCRIKFVDTSQQRCYRARGQLECETSLADFWHISRPLAIRVGGQVTETPPQTEHKGNRK